MITKTADAPFTNPTLSLEERLDALISRMTMEEKIGFILTETENERLGIGPYSWTSEALHGVARNGIATVFPMPINFGATMDEELIERIGDAVSDEQRVKHKISREHGMFDDQTGLNVFSPTINVFRDPRWGRGMEGYGEDPFINAALGAAYIRGLQGKDPYHLKVAACAKHCAVHSGPEGERHYFNSIVNMKDLFETYLPAFENAIKNNVSSIMTAYNMINGEACCANEFLMNQLIRKRWGFKGFIFPDGGSINDIIDGEIDKHDPSETIARCFKAGTDFIDGKGQLKKHLEEAIKKNFINENEINESLRRTLSVLFRLGLLDDPDTSENPYREIPKEKLRCEKHLQLTVETAEKSMVLIQNKDNLLPLENQKKIYLSGPLASDISLLLGNYYGLSPRMITFLEGIVAEAPEGVRVTYTYGAPLVEAKVINEIGYHWSVDAGLSSDVSIVFVGTSPLMEGEEGDAIFTIAKGDRAYELPSTQIKYLEMIRPKSKKLIVVVSSGGAVDMRRIMELADAVIWTGYPGEAGGLALGRILFGKTAPSGKLPFTIYKSAEDLPDFRSYSMEDRTYRYFEKPTQVPFGFGLGYSEIILSDTSVEKRENGLTIKTSVRNKGKMAQREVLQFYWSARSLDKTILASLGEHGKKQPKRSLIKTIPVTLDPGEEREIIFQIEKSKLMIVNNDGERVLPSGTYTWELGTAEPVERSLELGGRRWNKGSIIFTNIN